MSSTTGIAHIVSSLFQKPVAIGRVLPLLIGLALFLDIVLRFGPLEPFCFRPWECMTRYPEPGSIFQAHKQLRHERSYGNLANIGNLPNLREYRSVVFTTDIYGFRNESRNDQRPIAAILVGDSFVAGDGLTDHDIVSTKLASATGLRVYNAGGPYAYLGTPKSLKDRFHIEGGMVIVVYSQDLPISFLEEAEAQSRNSIRDFLRWATDEESERLQGLVKGWIVVSPLKIAAEKVYKSFADDRILPNVFKEEVVVGRLLNGDAILFLRSEVENFYRPRGDSEILATRDYFVQLQAALRQEGFELIVVLMPNKYSIYHSLLANPRLSDVDSVHPDARLQTQLHAKGVRVVNLTPTLLARAATDLREGQYLYWRDDTHWNDRGTTLAAELIWREWFQLPSTQS